MKKIAVALFAMILNQSVFAQNGIGDCELKISAANVQDGGILIGSEYEVSLPSIFPPEPNDGRPQDCDLIVSPNNLPNPRSYIQSNFLTTGIEHTINDVMLIKDVNLVALTGRGEEPQINFKTLRFTDGMSENSNIQELALYAKAGAVAQEVTIIGIWRQILESGMVAEQSAFPEMHFSAQELKKFSLTWSRNEYAGFPQTTLSLQRGTGAAQLVYEGGTVRPFIIPFSSTVGVLKQTGNWPQNSKIEFSTSYACVKGTMDVDCF